MKRLIVALNSSPNTFHTGLLVALANNWFEPSGLKVEIQLPDTGHFMDFSPLKVATEQAHIGLCSPQVLFAFHSHKCSIPLVAVSAPVQNNYHHYAVKYDADIHSLNDFAGKRFASKGTYGQVEELRYFLQREGNSSMIRLAETSSFTAIQNDEADVFYINSAWEGLKLEMDKKPLKYFSRSKEDLILGYNPVYIAHPNCIENYENELKLFFSILDKGYHLAANKPKEVAKLFWMNFQNMYENFDNLAFLESSLKKLSSDFLNSKNQWGVMSDNIWKEFLLANKRINKVCNKVNEKSQKNSCDYSEFLFTNSLLPYKL